MAENRISSGVTPGTDTLWLVGEDVLLDPHLRLLRLYSDEVTISNIHQDCHGWLGGSPIWTSIFDDFFQHLWPYIGNNTANVVFRMVKRLWLIRIDQ
ncbi:hypothetical protein TNCV_4062121 [Trichonephila clavipes]|nr:hypothetical protein TNCV_4062121 [Trichonephila clavipes]